MKIRGLDPVTQDWQYGQGVGSYAQNAQAIALDIGMSLRLWKGSAFFAPTVGVDYKNLLQRGQLKNMEIALQNCVSQVNGVVVIVSMPFKFNTATRALAVGPTVVETIYGKAYLAVINNLLGGPPSA